MRLRPCTLLLLAGLTVGLGLVLTPSSDAQLLRKGGIYYPESPTQTLSEPDAQLTDDQLLRTAGLSPDGAALIDFFKARTETTADPVKVAALVAKLGSKKAEERQKAMGGLVALGPLAVTKLRQATRDVDDPGTAAAARRCLGLIEPGPNGPSLAAAAARVLAAKKPEGTADALLDYLPYADDEGVLEEVKVALSSLVTKDGKFDSAFVRTLGDKDSPLKRAVVAEVLARFAGPDVMPAVHKLLADPKPVVRLRVALALADHKDADAVTTLINVLADLPLPLAKQSEEYLMNLASDTAPKAQLGETEASRKTCRDAWAAWWKKSEGDATLAEFKKRTLSEADREKVLALIKQMADDDFNVRERSQEDLQKWGSAVSPLLRQSLTAGADEEIKKRAQKALDTIDKDKGSTLLPVQAKLMAYRKPAGAAEVLLAYLPFADEEPVFDEVRGALAAVAVRDGKADPALVKALGDKLSVRRSVAAEALALGGATDVREQVRKLLKDADIDVKLRVALALAAARDKDAVPVLIDLMAELPTEKGTQAETFLREVAGERGPNVYLGPDADSKKKAKEAWAAWWKANGATADLARAGTGPRMLGYTLIVNLNFNRVLEIGLDGKVRWSLDNLGYPRDAQVLPGDRVLVAEQNFNRVAEYNQKKEIVWQKGLNAAPMAVERLKNGNTFIATNNGLMEVAKDGKETFTYNRNQWDIITGSRSPDGQYAILTNAGQIIRLDAKGKEIKTLNIGNAFWNSTIEALPAGRTLVPMYNQNKVVEYDADGKQVWEAAVQWPQSVHRLPNGNTLVASPNTSKVVELNRAGRVVWEHKAANNMEQPFRARRR